MAQGGTALQAQPQLQTCHTRAVAVRQMQDRVEIMEAVQVAPVGEPEME
jgi:hypothetical protein